MTPVCAVSLFFSSGVSEAVEVAVLAAAALAPAGSASRDRSTAVPDVASVRGSAAGVWRLVSRDRGTTRARGPLCEISRGCLLGAHRVPPPLPSHRRGEAEGTLDPSDVRE